MRKVLAAAVFIAAMFFDLRPAPAQEAPWCAVVSLGFGEAYEDCRYNSLEECRPHVLAGNRGFCSPNPRWSGWNQPAERPRHYGRRR
jgi:hypothetical protein